MNLVIVESPTKARTLSRFLGDDYRITSTMGHIKDLPDDRLGVDTKQGFKPHYTIIKGRGDQVKKIKQEANTANWIILATDPDREGEAIAYHVTQVIKSNSKFQRIVFHEITESAIKEALNQPRDIDMQLVDAQQARRVLDRLVGYKLSPLLWYKVRKGLSAGRVQSVAVRLIVEREREIEAFKPQEYWVIEAELKKVQSEKDKTQNFIAKLAEKDGKKIEIKNKETADQVVNNLRKATYSVSNIEKKEARRYPYPPFTTSTLQQAAVNLYGWTAKKTMQLAQKLYEEGYITYHRTDSTNIAKEAIFSVRAFINKVWGESHLPHKPIFYKTKSKVAQEAHEAIRPTNIQVVFDQEKASETKLLPQQIGREAGRLYALIWKRFVACQMREAIYDQTTVDIKADSWGLSAKGSLLKFAGWLVVFAKTSAFLSPTRRGQGEVKLEEDHEKRLPPLEVGEPLHLVELYPQQKFTQPPPRYNEASLIKALEEKGIGRPSTYAPILSTIQDRHYVEKLERRFQPTQLGISVNDFLVKHFSDIVNVSFTAKMEDDLDSIARGEIAWVSLVQQFYHPFNQRLTTAYRQAERVKVETEETSEICPECSHPLVIRIGKYGKFIACSTYPNCKFTKPYIEKAGVSCPKCAGEVIIKKTKRGKRFYGCINYPKCDFASWKKPK